MIRLSRKWGFRDSSVHKKSTCSAGEPGLIPGSGRSPGEGMGYLLQYSWTSLMTQTVNNPPAIRELRARLLEWEDSLKEGMGNPLQYSCLENPMDRGAWRAIVHRVTRVGPNLAQSFFLLMLYLNLFPLEIIF